jgi:hypothetical protein
MSYVVHENLDACQCELDDRVDYSTRGCANPNCRAETRHYVTWRGLDFCEKCIGVIKLAAFGEAVKACKCHETGEP